MNVQPLTGQKAAVRVGSEILTAAFLPSQRLNFVNI